MCIIYNKLVVIWIYYVSCIVFVFCIKENKIEGSNIIYSFVILIYIFVVRYVLNNKEKIIIVIDYWMIVFFMF